MTLEEIQLMVIKKVSEIAEAVPQPSGKFFYYDDTGVLKKAPMTEIYNLVSNSKSLGTITTASTIPAEGNVWAFAAPGTYPNAGNLTVSPNTVGILTRVGGTWSKVEVELPQNKIPTWTAQAYPSGSQVIHNGKIYEANDAVLSTDIPGESNVWKKITEFNKALSKNIITNYKDNFYVDAGSGIEQPLSGYSIGFGNVEPNTEYTALYPYFQLAFYDKNHVYISGIASASTFTTPSNAYYFKVSVDTLYRDYYTISKGNVPTFIPQRIIGSSIIGVKAENIAGIDLVGLEKIVNEIDVFEKNKIIRNTYIDASTGLITRVGDNNYYATFPIRIEGGSIYEFGNTLAQQYAFYDKNGKYIVGYAPETPSKTIMSPHDAYYIMFTGVYSEIESQFLIKSKTDNLYDKWALKKNHYVGYYDGVVHPVSDVSTTHFIPVRPNTSYAFGDIKNQQMAWYDNNKEYISGMAGSISGYEEIVTSPNNAYYVRFNTGNNDLNTQYFRELQNDNDVRHVYITAVKNAKNWNSVRDILREIKDANPRKKYHITIPNGIWNECDWGFTNEHIIIKGENRYETIIMCDGTDANPDHIVPDDYMGYGNFSGEKFSTIPQSARHLIYVRNNTKIENITLIAKSCKYVVHADDNRFKGYDLFNCNIENAGGCNSAFGIGTWSGQSNTVRYCKIIEPVSTNQVSGVFLHNTKEQTKDTYYHFLGCAFVNCDYLTLLELESGVSDVVILESCSGGGAVKFGVSNEFGGLPENAKYNLQLIVANTIVSNYIQENRPQYMTKNQL